jgi:ribonuclease BN (tRNA processing enzyme)
LIFIPARVLSGPPRSAQVARQSAQADRFVAKLLQNRYAVSHAFFTHLHYDHCMDYGRLVLQRWPAAIIATTP